MPCNVLKKDGQVVGFICSRGRQKLEPCYTCGRPAKWLCDHQLESGGTCDRPLCYLHRHPAGVETDYCEEHYQALAARQTRLENT